MKYTFILLYIKQGKEKNNNFSPFSRRKSFPDHKNTVGGKKIG